MEVNGASLEVKQMTSRGQGSPSTEMEVARGKIDLVQVVTFPNELHYFVKTILQVK